MFEAMGWKITLLAFAAVVAGEKPGPVAKLNAVQKVDTLDLLVTWSPPNQPNGIIKSYDVLVSANGKNMSSQTVEEPKFTFTVTEKKQLAEKYSFEVRAVNNAEDDSKFGDFTETHLAIAAPEPPTAVKLVIATDTALDFTIERKTQAELGFQISYPNSEPYVTLGDEEVIQGLSPYTEVPISVAACITFDEELEDAFCGAAFNVTFKTNVGGPSQARNLTLDASDGVASLSWAEPESLAGPLDGYIVHVSNIATSVVTDLDAGKNLEFTYDQVRNCSEYEFSVWAFNNDIRTGAKVNGTATNVLPLKTEFCEVRGDSGFPAWAIVLIVLAVLAVVGGGGTFYCLKVRRD